MSPFLEGYLMSENTLGKIIEFKPRNISRMSLLQRKFFFQQFSGDMLSSDMLSSSSIWHLFHQGWKEPQKPDLWACNWRAWFLNVPWIYGEPLKIREGLFRDGRNPWNHRLRRVAENLKTPTVFHRNRRDGDVIRSDGWWHKIMQNF